MINYFNYFTEVERFYQSKRESFTLLSSLDWVLIETWKEQGVPLEVVLKGIERAFSRAKRKVNSLAYCMKAVTEVIEEEKEGRIDKPALPDFSSAETAKYLEDLSGKVAAVSRLFPEFGGRIGAIAESVRTLDAADLQKAEQTLTVLEEQLIAILQVASDEKALIETRRSVDAELNPFRSTMTTEQLARLEQQLWRRKLMEKYAAPRLESLLLNLVQITIEKLVYGGAGLARTENGVVFVHRTVPGDVAEVEITDRKKDYSTARLVKILESGPSRQEPTCPNYHTAGCCHWQHVKYSKQVDFKEEILRETLHRAGRIDWSKEIRRITGPDAGYRLRAAFHVRDHQLGFVRERGNTVVAITECNALTGELNAWIPEANRMLASPEMSTVAEVHAIAGNTVGASFASSLHQFGDEPPRVQVNGFTFDLHPNAFFQSNRFLLDSFMAEVLDQAGPSPKYVLDLYCGSGFFSIPLAKRCAEIIGVESNRTAIKQAKKNARLNDVWNATFVEGQVDKILDNVEARPDLIILNPPRTGCGKDAAAKAAALGARRLVYVSCNPSTFAREAAVLLARGYELQKISLIDQFPNTYHIEMAAEFGLE